MFCSLHTVLCACVTFMFVLSLTHSSMCLSVRENTTLSLSVGTVCVVAVTYSQFSLCAVCIFICVCVFSFHTHTNWHIKPFAVWPKFINNKQRTLATLQGSSCTVYSLYHIIYLCYMRVLIIMCSIRV